MKKSISISVASLLIIAMMCVSVMPEQAYAEVAKTDAPTGAVGLKWKWKPGKGSPTPPLIHGDSLYVCAGNVLYKLNKNTGDVIKSVTLSGNVGYSMMPPVKGDNKIFVSIGSGKIQALDINTLSSLWVSSSEGLSGQTITPIIYKNKQVFTGTYSSAGGHFFSVDTDTGAVKWKVYNAKGYYWSGAYASDNAVVFGSDANKSGNSVITSVKPQTGEVLSTMSAVGNIRSTIAYDSGNLYVGTQGRKLYKIPLKADGALDSGNFEVVGLNGETTGEPTVFNGELYVGIKNAAVSVYDLSTFKLAYSMGAPGYAQNGVLITKQSDGKNYIYSTYNNPPGGIAMGQLKGKSTTLNGNYFVPADSQFCLSPIVADESSGVLYYKNDSFNLMAVDKGENAFTPTPKVSSASYNSLKIKWEKASNASGYDLFRSNKANGTYKKIKSPSKTDTTYTDKKLKIGQKYYYKLRAKYTDENGGIINGLYSKVASAKPELKAPKIKTKAKKKSIKITWKKISGADGYVVYRSTKKKSGFKKVKTIKKGKTKTWTNKNLRSKKKYYYKVKAYRKSGNKKVYSVFSNISYKKSK